MLQRVAVVGSWMGGQCRLYRVKRNLSAFIAIGVNMYLDARLIIGIDQCGQTGRFNIP